tara:strand:- start:19088 stop:19597 length:510 start_codon:yes stop_codon:yes gene_type:complete
MLNLKNKHQNNLNPKVIYVKIFSKLEEIEIALESIKERYLDLSQISILSKNLERFNDGDTDSTLVKPSLVDYWSSVYGVEQDIGFLNVPEIGTCFVLGPLAPVLLNILEEGKILGEFEGGLNGVLLGFGAKKSGIPKYTAALKNDDYLVVVRGTPKELKNIAVILEKNK